MCQRQVLNSQSSWLHFPGAEITDVCHQHWLIYHNLNLMGEIVQGVAAGPVQGFGLLLSFVPLILTVCSSRPKKQNASRLFTSSSLKLLLNSRGLRSLRCFKRKYPAPAIDCVYSLLCLGMGGRLAETPS